MANTVQPRDSGHIDITTSSFSRLHRQRKHLEFTNACEQRKVIPAFCKLSYKTIRTNKIRSNEVKKFETRRLSDAIRENKEKILKLENNFESSKNLLFYSSDSPRHSNLLLHNIKKFVFQAAHSSDRKRDLKLSKLTKKAYPTFNEAEVINNTGVAIPPNILNFLKLGSEFATGGGVQAATTVQIFTLNLTIYLKNFVAKLENWA